MRVKVIALLALPLIAFAVLEFSDPVLCCDSISEWWTGQTGAIGRQGELYAAWTHTGIGSRDGGIYFARSLDTNRTWSRNITIHYWDPTWIHATYWEPKLYAVGDSVYCIYSVKPEYAHYSHHFYCSRSDDRGSSWNIFETSISGLFSGITGGHDFCATSTGTVHLVFSTKPGYPEDFRLYYCRSTDGGVTFSEPALMPGATANISYTVPSLALLNNGTILVAARKSFSGGRSILLFRSTNNGASWDTIDLAHLNSVSGMLLLKEGRWGRLHLLFEDLTHALFATHSDDNGQTWSPPFAITDDNFSYGFAVDERRLFVCWNDDNYVSYYRLSEDNGATWSEVNRIWTGEPFPGDWLAYDVDIKDGLITLTMHNEPGSQEGTWCAVGEWQVAIGEPASSANRKLQLLARPNPFTRRVSFTLPQEFNNKMVTIYDPTGRMVRRLMINDGKAEWDGTAETGQRLARGVYLARVSGLTPLQLVLGE